MPRIAAQYTNCVKCGKRIAVRSGRTTRPYCSIGCLKEHTIERRERVCVHCGSAFLSPSSNRASKFCSTACQYANKVGERAPGWKGGVTKDSATGRVSVLVCSGHYVQEHRLVVSAILGRKLMRREEIVHMDANLSNNNPENLYLFSSRAQKLAHIQARGHPKASNISPLTYLDTSDRGDDKCIPFNRADAKTKMLPEPTVGTWSDERVKWTRGNAKIGRLVQTHGTPRTKGRIDD